LARVVAARPAALALVHEGLGLTYEEVDRRSDALAALIARSVPAPGAPVVILAADPVATILSVLATW
jgi:non-ribosomal peptide synthetase component F